MPGGLLNTRDPSPSSTPVEVRLELISIPNDVLEKWQTVVDNMAEVMGVPAGLIMRTDGEDIAVVVSSRTPGNPYHVGESERLAGSGLYCEAVIASGADLMVADALADPAWRNNPDVPRGMVSYLGFPIFWPNKKPFGTICVLARRNNVYSETYRRLVGQFRDLIQHYLALIYLDTQGRLDAAAQRRRDEEALRSSEERFTAAFHLAPVPMAVATPDGFRYLAVNDAFLTVTGYAREEMIGRDAVELHIVSPAELLGFKLELEKPGGVRNREMQLHTKTGAIIDCLVSAEMVTLGVQRCVLAALQDNTERKRSEAELAVAIEAAMQDASWFSRTVMEKLAQLRRSQDKRAPQAELADLTPREFEVLGLMSDGHNDEDIAAALKLSRNTVRNHLATIYSKLGVHRRSDAVVWARERGIIGHTPPKQRRRP